jgi:leader peptidase (prepilin peptidase) / N-methyltransferase
MASSKATSQVAPGLYPALAPLVGGAAVISAISIWTLPWHAAIVSIALGMLMIAGADIDSRTYLLPDTVTIGTILLGLLASFILRPAEPAFEIGMAIFRASGTAFVIAMLRWSYAYLRQREGLGFGDVKLSAGVGACLPLELIPLCFGLAATGALVLVLSLLFRGHEISGSLKLPFGAFLCPALWLMFYFYLLFVA